MNRALFLDRDGVINEDYGYVHKVEDFHFRNGIFDVCRAAQAARFKIVIVTNQAGIGRGIYGLSEFNSVTRHMLNRLNAHNITISSIYHCPYHPIHGIGHYKCNSFNRKPNPGMIVAACADHDINPSASLMVGDKESDKIASQRAGIRFYIDASQKSWAKDTMKILELI